jgi:hypothetical protein
MFLGLESVVVPVVKYLVSDSSNMTAADTVNFNRYLYVLQFAGSIEPYIGDSIHSYIDKSEIKKGNKVLNLDWKT